MKQASRDAGFEFAGIAPVRDFDELDRFREWVAAGRAGEMQYLQARDDSGALKRASLRITLPWARSVIVCAINYNTAHPYSTQVDDPERGWIARYAWGQQDYHEAVLKRLRTVERAVRDAASAAEIRELQTRSYVDTGPLVERVYAKYAGAGWFGKNTCIINQKLGSWLFLGVILTSLELEADLPAPDRCGTCTRCIDACPTDALVAPYQLDSNRCISYLTIEKRGSIAEDIRSSMGHEVFGCDICQDVCPWNRKAPTTTADEFQPKEHFVNPALEWMAGITVEDFQQTFRGSAIRRAKRSGLRRNAVIAMGNSGNPRFRAILESLKTDEDKVIAETAEWAARQLSQKAPSFEAKAPLDDLINARHQLP